MHHFQYRDGVLHAEGLSLSALAEEIGTPFYCYSQATLERHYKVFAEAFGDRDVMICYAMKANSNQAVIRTLARQGAGMDVVSEGELLRARAAGVPGRRIMFSGVGKTAREMALALDMGIHCFNVESEPELETLSRVASVMGKTAPVSMRVNPDVDARTHEKITTGKAENKFGVSFEQAIRLYAKAAASPGLQVIGIDMHIGSQITDLQPFEDAFSLLRELVQDLRREGHDIQHVDLGGGLGIPYGDGDDLPPHPEEYAAKIIELMGDLDCRLIFEPGRMIAGNAGILVSKVLYVKEGDDKRFTIIDAGMNDLIRPTLYEAYHEIKPVQEALAREQLVKMDVVGPVCETGDYMARERLFPPFAPGDLVAIMTAGAYGAVQANVYNSRALVPEVLVNGDRHALIRKRVELEELIARDVTPEWLADDPSA